MKSFSDLNSYSNTPVTYASESDYLLTWTTSEGDVTTSQFEGSSFLVAKQIDLLVATDITRDILVTIVPSSMAPVAFVQYTGADANISVVTDGISSWTVMGIRTVAQYSNVFANLYVGITPGQLEPFSFSTRLDDQMGDPIQTWLTTVTVLDSEVFVAPTSIEFNEDESTRVANVQITENFLYATNYTITITPENPATAQIAFAPGNVAANSWTTTSTKASINSQLANLVFVPRPDFAGNTYFDTSVTRVYNSETTGKRTLANCAVTHPDYSAPSGYGWSENATTTIGSDGSTSLAITDLAIGKNYTSNVVMSPNTVGNLYVSGIISGNSVSFSGNKTQVNANLATVTFIGNVSNKINGNIQYVQTQTTDNILQGNITIPLTYQIPAIHIYSNVAKSFGTRLNSSGGYDSGLATANVDFWAYQYQTNTSTSGGITYFNYTSPNTANVSLTSLRSTSSYKYGPLGIIIKDRYGIRSRLDTTRSAGSANYIGFWIRMNKNHQFAVYGGAYTSTTGGGAGRYWMQLMSYNNSMYWANYSWLIDGPSLDDSSSIWYERIQLGANPTVGEWTHFALQISAGTTGPSGTQVVSAWRNGVPITEFYTQGGAGGGGPPPFGTLQTGTTWNGKGTFDMIQGWKFGANFGAPIINNQINGINGTTKPWLDITVDDIVVRGDAPYTNLVAFTPTAGSWGGNVRQLVTGI